MITPRYELKISYKGDVAEKYIKKLTLIGDTVPDNMAAVIQEAIRNSPYSVKALSEPIYAIEESPIAPKETPDASTEAPEAIESVQAGAGDDLNAPGEPEKPSHAEDTELHIHNGVTCSGDSGGVDCSPALFPFKPVDEDDCPKPKSLWDRIRKR